VCRLRGRCEAVRGFLGEEEAKCFGRALLLGGVLILRLWKDIDMFAAWNFVVIGRMDVEMA
jgi:hypothetical protein